MKKVKNSDTIIICEGRNITKFINICTSSNICIKNACRLDSKTIEFALDDVNLKKFEKLDLKDYDIKIKCHGGKRLLKNILIARCGLLIGILISIVSFFFINNRMINIQISGLSRYSRNDVIEEISNYGLHFFCKMDIDIKGLENHLTNAFDFSFVSIITKGNTLIINVKEEILDITSKYLPITADYDMVITSINVYAGNSTLKEGDIVYKGDILVNPFEFINNEKKDVVPMAEIKGDVYFSSRYTFKNEEKIIVRTGNSCVLNSTIYLGKFKLFEDKIKNQFATFDVEEVENIVSHYFLPIKIRKVIAHEIKEETIINNFEDMKEGIIDDLKKDVYNKVPENFNIENEEIVISSINYGNIVTIYLKTSVYLNYK